MHESMIRRVIDRLQGADCSMNEGDLFWDLRPEVNPILHRIIRNQLPLPEVDLRVPAIRALALEGPSVDEDRHLLMELAHEQGSDLQLEALLRLRRGDDPELPDLVRALPADPQTHPAVALTAAEILVAAGDPQYLADLHELRSRWEQEPEAEASPDYTYLLELMATLEESAAQL